MKMIWKVITISVLFAACMYGAITHQIWISAVAIIVAGGVAGLPTEKGKA